MTVPTAINTKVVFSHMGVDHLGEVRGHLPQEDYECNGPLYLVAPLAADGPFSNRLFTLILPGWRLRPAPLDWEENPKCQTLLQRWVREPDTDEWRRETKSKDA